MLLTFIHCCNFVNCCLYRAEATGLFLFHCLSLGMEDLKAFMPSAEKFPTNFIFSVAWDVI